MRPSVIQDESNAAIAMMRQGQWTEAAALLRADLALQPHSAIHLRRLGVCERQLEHINLSIELLKLSTTYDNHVAETWFELGCSYSRAERTESALAAFTTAHQLRPEWSDPPLNIGALYERLGNYSESLIWLQLAARINPSDELIHFNLGNTWQNQGAIAQAITAYQQAIQLQPKFAHAHWNLSLCQLLSGDFANGWQEYRWRSIAGAVKHDNYPQPVLKSLDNLFGKTVLIHGEQGIGDEIMFASCLDELQATGARVILVCDPRLVTLFQRSFPLIRVVGHSRRKDRTPLSIDEPVDFQLPVGDLPRFFRNKIADFPVRDHYLVADPQAVSTWQARFQQLGPGLRLGISWRAGGHPIERQRRSTCLSDWLPLLQSPGVQWINLQYGETDRERAQLAHEHGITIHDWTEGDPLLDLDQFAARMSALDGIISVGNTTVHLAGALGLPAWVILPVIPAWRWMLHGDKVPWYQSVTCFRQQSDDSWPDFFQRLSQMRWSSASATANSTNTEIKQTIQLSSSSKRNKPVPITFDVNQTLLQIQELNQRQDWAAAERLCDDLLAHAPRNASAWHLLSHIARATKRLDLTIRALERALELSNQHPVIRQELAETLLNHGKFDQALTHFQALVLSKPDLFEAWLGLGLCQRCVGNLDAAHDALSRAETIDSKQPKVHNFLGGILMEMQRVSAAIASFRRAIEISPNYTAAWNNLGCVLHKQQDYTGAAECFAKIVQLEPKNETAANALRECLKQSECKEPTDIAPVQNLQVKVKAPFVQQQLEQAAQLYNQDQFEEAARLAEQILEHEPKQPVALRIVGVGHRRRHEYPQSIQKLKTAIEVDPNSFALYFELGVSYLESHQHQPAYECFLKCLEIKPDFQAAYINLSGIMEQQERYEDATHWAKRAVEVSPNSAMAYYNLGNSLREQGQILHAIEAYSNSLKQDPNYIRATWNLGICNLHLGIYSQGWPRYEVRGPVGEVDFDQYPQPLWKGESLTDKTILVHAEQGLGDEIVFCSCLPDLIPLAKQVVIVCEPRLEKLFRRSFPTCKVYGFPRRKDHAPCPVAEQIDYQLPMGSLPLHFRSKREAFPRSESFLTPDPKLVQEWKDRLATIGSGLKVGISWRAGGKPLERRKRSIAPDLWGPIFNTPGAQFVNLQYGDASSDAEEIRELFGVELHDWEQGDPLIDIDNFAAKIAALDLVISVGNATVHMSGAVGTPAWTLLPMIPSWRWMIKGDESPWYKRVRLFRQPVRKAWTPVLTSLGEMLQQLMVSPREQWRELASKLPCPPITAEPRREKPIAEHVWLDHTQFSALASLEQIPATMDAAKNAYEHGEFDRAAELLQSVLQIAPKFPSALHQLGLVALKQGRVALAIRSIQRALATAENVPLRRCDLALAYQAAHRIDEAIACYNRALEINPTFTRAHAELAQLLHEQGQTEAAQKHFLAAGLSVPVISEPTAPVVTESVQSYSQAMSTRRDHSFENETQQIEEAIALKRAGQIDAAIELLQSVIRADETNGEARYVLAEMLIEEQLWSEAQQHLNLAIKLDPTAKGFWLRAKIALHHGHKDQALADLELTLQLKPDNVMATKQAASLAYELNRAVDAEHYYRLALKQQPRSTELQNSLGLCLAAQGRWKDAIDCYQSAIQNHSTDFAIAHMNLALAKLQLGQYATGWEEYEYRWKVPQNAALFPTRQLPHWHGESLAGKRILIQPEQGLGDELMFATCYQQVIEQAQEVTLICDPRLKNLWTAAFPQARIVPVVRGQEQFWNPPAAWKIDYQVMAGSLPKYLRRDRAAFGQGTTFLQPDATLAQSWKQQLLALPPGPRIGIAWRAGQHARDMQLRSLAVTQLVDLLSVPGAQWINLQHGDVQDDLRLMQEQHGIQIHDWPEQDLKQNLDHVAARIAGCDLVIAVGSAVVHFAGSLGVETWNLLPANSGWRWGPVSQPTPWYSSVTSLRQTESGDWSQLLWQLPSRLRQWLAQHSNRIAAQQALELAAQRHSNPVAAPHFSKTRAAQPNEKTR